VSLPDNSYVGSEHYNAARNVDSEGYIDEFSDYEDSIDI
jgi:hypothetical protein